MNLPSNNNDLILSRSCTFEIRISLSGLDGAFFAFNIHSAFFLINIECVQTVRCWRIFDISRGDAEAG